MRGGFLAGMEHGEEFMLPHSILSVAGMCLRVSLSE